MMKLRNPRFPKVVAMTALFSTIAYATNAFATECGYSLRTSWNVPNGALVANRTTGPLRSLMDAINEWNTHVALSHGTQGWISHSAPGAVRRGDHSVPIKRSWLDFADWGPSQVSLPAMFNYYFGFKVSRFSPGSIFSYEFGDYQQDDQRFAPGTVATRGSNSPAINIVASSNVMSGALLVGQSDLLTQEWYSGNNPSGDWMSTSIWGAPQFVPGNSNRGATVANWLWNDIPYASVTSSGQTIYDLRGPGGTSLAYRWYDLMNLGFANNGHLEGGAVCSVLQSYASVKSGAGRVSEKQYDHDKTVLAINALWTAVRKSCEDGQGLLGDLIIFFGSDVCDRAANQMVNAFVRQSSDTSSGWKAVRDAYYTKATSISPDCVAGWSCFSTGGGASPWGWDWPRPVQWNGEGRVFGCWE